MTELRGAVDLDALRGEYEAGRIDTVLLCLADMQGRLQGKRLSASHFLDDVAEHGAEGCNYLLAVDVDMETVSGYQMTGWHTGYGDFEMMPDLETLRVAPWLPGTALVMADLRWEDGSAVVASPRQILRRQLDRLADRGLQAFAGSELEFIVFHDTYQEAWRKAYRDLDPANYYNVDYSILGTTKVEPLLRRVRNAMEGMGMPVESAKGECNFGQHEINFRYSQALEMADNHTIYKNAAKEIATQEGYALTFMAKFNELEGNSCHIHFSLRGADGEAVFADGHDMAPMFRSFVAGQIAGLREMTLCYAPNINSYKRFVEGSFAPTVAAWGFDNRTCAFRVVGHGKGMRVENRVPGGDVNPYLAMSAMIAAGLDGIDRELELEDAMKGNAYESDNERVPETLRDAAELFSDSKLARKAFGDDVVDHYRNMADVELAAFNSAVTDWERYRNFERT
ncbi:MAG: glutamine synthetase family protein [Actinobacteria bacterium]|nr:glutamine synthetase family protein [Actinomycetota bacterium]